MEDAADEVIERLFISSEAYASNTDALASLGVSHVLICTGKPPPPHTGTIDYKVMEIQG
jgi:hypothetical protein